MAFIKKQAQPSTEQTQSTPETRDCQSLLKQLSSSDSTERRWAARDLVECPECANALMQRLKIETENSVREVILTTLTRMGDPVAIAGMVDCLRSEDAALRNEVVEAMKQLPLEVAPMMLGLLADPDPDVRIFAVNVLESLCHPEVESWLISVITDDAHVNVCATAVDLLGEVGSSNAIQTLEQLKARFSEEPYIQFAADLALRRINEN
ncbi:MAG: HEAT repeat domain-containing protein [Methylococcales bacterium]|nr:MAG: HEAT repeat domain-containing protein [Methylococcales bacterium]